MAIELTTGLPGNAKTLFVIGHLIKKAKAENRAVYYNGLLDFKTDDPRLEGTTWVHLEDPKQWHTVVPAGAIIFIDEAQETFRSRSLGTIPGEHVTLLEKHRHRGLDFFLITQHPSLIDPAIRKLTQTHRHMVRVFGAEMSTVHLWRTGVRDNCEKTGGRKDSEKTKWAFRKDLYGLYKSAEVHTVKRQIPPRLIFVVVAPVLVAACAYGVYHFMGKTQPAAVVAKEHRSDPVTGENLRSGRIERIDFDPLADARQYVAMNMPRIEGLPHTAPKYDAITAPVRAPIPAMCLQTGTPGSAKGVSCKCYTQQATPMQVEFNMCVEFARNGYFQDFDADKDREQVARSERSVQVLSNEPDHGARAAAAAAESKAIAPSQLLSMSEVRSPGGLGVNPAPNLNDGPPRGVPSRTVDVPPAAPR